MKYLPTLHMDNHVFVQSLPCAAFRRFRLYLLPFLLLVMAAVYVRAETGQVSWSWPVPDSTSFECTPTVGDDGIIYMATRLNLFGLNQTGTLASGWSSGLPFGGQLDDHGSASSPAIGINGNIFIGGTDSTRTRSAIYAFSPSAVQLWSQNQDVTGNGGDGPDIFSTPAIGRDGTLYFGTDDEGKIYAANWFTGASNWSFVFTGGADADIDSSLAVGMNGSVFYIGEHNNFFAALTPQGSSGSGVVEWLARVQSDINGTFGLSSHFNSSPAIDLDGTLYIGGINGLYAIGSNGGSKWTFIPPFTDPTSSIFFQSSPVIGPDESIYIGASDGRLYAISVSNCEPSEKWSFYPSGWDTNVLQPILSTPAVASNDIVYVTIQDPTNASTWLFAVDTTTGAQSWGLNLAPTSGTQGTYVSSSPTIGSNGTVYVADTLNLYAVTGTPVALAHVACSPWPMYHHDAKHTGNQNPLGMLAWWPAENNAIDIVGNHSGTVSSGVTFSTGEVGNCFSLNGSTGHITVPASSDFNLSSSPGLTIEGWIDPTTTSSTGQAIAEWSDSSHIGVQFFVSELFGTPNFAAGSLYANVRDTSGHDHFLNSGGGFVTANAFNHVAMTYDINSGVLDLYCNGVLIATTTFSGVGTLDTTEPLNLGCRAFGGLQDFFPGKMDELAVYNRALTGAELNAIYQNGSVRHMGKCSESLDINW